MVAQSLVAWRRVNRGGYRPFLQHVTAGRPVATRPLRVRQSRRLPRTLTEDQLLTTGPLLTPGLSDPLNQSEHARLNNDLPRLFDRLDQLWDDGELPR